MRGLTNGSKRNDGLPALQITACFPARANAASRERRDFAARMLTPIKSPMRDWLRLAKPVTREASLSSDPACQKEGCAMLRHPSAAAGHLSIRAGAALAGC